MTPLLTTAVYQPNYRDYRRRHDELHLKLQHAERQLDRQRELIQTGATARMDLEQAAYEVTLLQNSSGSSPDSRPTPGRRTCNVSAASGPIYGGGWTNCTSGPNSTW